MENPAPGDGEHRNLLRKGSDSFMISAEPARQAQVDLPRRAAAKVFRGAALVVACLRGILRQFERM